MNELIERLQKEISTWGGHLAPIEVLLKDSLDTLLALQTQLERAEDAADGYSRGVYSKTMLDAAAAIAKGHSDAFLILDLRAQLERVEREMVDRIKSPLFRQFLRQGFWHAHHVDLVWRYDGKDIREEADWLKDVWYAALPSAKTATETE